MWVGLGESEVAELKSGEQKEKEKQQRDQMEKVETKAEVEEDAEEMEGGCCPVTIMRWILTPCLGTLLPPLALALPHRIVGLSDPSHSRVVSPSPRGHVVRKWTWRSPCLMTFIRRELELPHTPLNAITQGYCSSNKEGGLKALEEGEEDVEEEEEEEVEMS